MNSEYLKNAPPEYKILWDYASALIAYNTITPLYYQGVSAGSEFLTYAATKLYIALELTASDNAQASTTGGQITCYDQANVISQYLTNYCIYWDTTAAGVRYGKLIIKEKDLYFGRLVFTNISYIKFIGYRLNV